MLTETEAFEKIITQWLTNQAGCLQPIQPNPCKFVLDHGWFYTPIPRPRGTKLGKPKQCFHNAVNHDGPLTYCEGYAFSQTSSTPIHHAWLTDGQGNAIDITWRKPGTVYIGVPFNRQFVIMEALKYGASIALLDNWEHDWPLLTTHLNQPAEWLELKGKGCKKITK